MDYKIIAEDNISTILENKRGDTYVLNTDTFAVLSSDPDNPLYCVSVSNNSFSIDLWRGCQLGCAYCHVQGCYHDLRRENGHLSICYKPVRRNNSKISEIVNALIKYKDFIADYSIISICTSSTEPFINDEVTTSTIEVMQEFVNQGYHNPFWIVTKKGGINSTWSEAIRRIVNHGNKIVLSVCWTNNSRSIEPYIDNRFNNLSWMVQEGVILNWYMRPLVKEWNASEENLRYIMEYVRDLRLPFVNIVAGGLRWTEGIEFGLRFIHNIPLPYLLKDDNKKTLCKGTEELIKKLHKEIFGDVPIFFNSGCAISHALQIPQINAQWICESNRCLECIKDQRDRCGRIKEMLDVSKLNHRLERQNTGLVLEKKDGNIVCTWEEDDYSRMSLGLKRLSYEAQLL